MTRRGTGQQRANRLNGLAVATYDAAHVRLAQLNSEDCCLPRRNFGEHHLVRKLDELANDEFEELFHGSKTIRPCAQAASPGTKQPRSPRPAVAKMGGLESAPLKQITPPEAEAWQVVQPGPILRPLRQPQQPARILPRPQLVPPIPLRQRVLLVLQRARRLLARRSSVAPYFS